MNLLLEKVPIIPGIIGWDKNPPGSDGLDFNVPIYGTVKIFGTEFGISKTIVTTWFFMIVLFVIALILRAGLKKYTDKPQGSQNVVEMLVEAMDSFTKSNMGEKYAYFGKWFFGVFTFILLSNLSGLLGFRPPTADLSTTAAITVTTFFLIHFMGISKGKAGYFKGYVEPIPILLPINIISELATPISLSFRLFGNILGGLIIMAMIYSALEKSLFQYFVPAVAHLYFDLFAGVLQTVIFCMLSQLFIKDKIPD